jgi:pentatricopeptide repeat protein
MFRGDAVARPDLITYSTMIKGYCKEKNIESALVMLETMQ